MVLEIRQMMPFEKLLLSWKNQNSASKSVIFLSILLVIFAYLPTIQFDYATQDQWRAFRYSIEAQSPLDRLKQCSSMISILYLQTGRPFVWPTECIEHSLVSTISDFNLLRPFVLATVILTVLYMASVISIFVGHFSIGIVAAALFVMAPGYSFMYFQGMPALMVLIAVFFATASYKKFTEINVLSYHKWKEITSSSIYFLIACLIYPAYAFIVLPYALLSFATDIKSTRFERIRKLFFAVFFYGISSALYYLIVKISVAILASTKGSLPNVGAYEVTIQLSPTFITHRLQEVAQYFYAMPPLNFSSIHGLPLAILVAFSITAGVILAFARTNGNYALKAITESLIVLVVGCLILAASISPWLFSKMEGLGTRHLMPFYLFLSIAVVWMLAKAIEGKIQISNDWAPVIVIASLLLPASYIQNRLSFLEIVVTGVEIEAMRAKIHHWVDTKGWIDKRLLLIVRPGLSRPLGIAGQMNTGNYGNDNAVLASSRNPVSIPWMFNALVRERDHKPEFKVIDCASDVACIGTALENTKSVVIAYINGNVTINSSVEPYVINLSELTKNPAYPTTKIAESPSILVTSTLNDYSAHGILSSVPPAWHAEENPRYPQIIKIDFKENKSIGRLGLLPQDSHMNRMPKSLRVKTSANGNSWTDLGTYNDLCEQKGGDGWHEVKLATPVEARHIQIEIYSNCGDPRLLTLKGLRVHP